MEFPSGKVLEKLPIGRTQLIAAPARGNYVILSPVQDALTGLMDLQSQKILIGLKKTIAMDIYDDDVLAETSGGDIGIFSLAAHKVVSHAAISGSPLDTIRAESVSPDLQWLAVSERTRGAVWNLATAKRTYYVRGFRGAYFDANRVLYADFPKQDPVNRTIGRLDLNGDDITPGISVDEDLKARQYGKYLVLWRPAHKEGRLDRDVTLDFRDVIDGHSLWTRAFRDEVPAVHPAASEVLLDWPVEDAAARKEIKNDLMLQKSYSAMQNHTGGYLVEVLNADTGETLGKILVDTGKGSFHIESAYAAGGRVVLGDTENRVHLYSLSTGKQDATFFGSLSTLSSKAHLFLVQNDPGQLDIYSLQSFEKITQLSFSSPIAMMSFSADGKKLFVLTKNQTAYFCETAALAAPDTSRAQVQ